MERLFAIKFPNHRSILKVLCRRSLIIIYIFICIFAGNCSVIYSYSYESGNCYIIFNPDNVQRVFILIYQGFVLYYLITGLVLLPAVSCMLTVSIYQIQQNSKILQQSWKSNPNAVEVKISKQFIIISIYTVICMFPSCIWILRGMLFQPAT